MVGAGAMGASIGGFLKKGGEDVFFVDPWLEQVDAINAHGLEMDVGGEVTTLTIPAFTDPSGIGSPVDVVIILTKGQHTDSAVRSAKCLFGGHTRCLTLQNGVGNTAVIADHVDKGRIDAGIIQLGAESAGMGRVKVLRRADAKVTLGPAFDDEPGEALRNLSEALSRGGLPCEAVSRKEVLHTIWYKMTVNGSGNAASALVGLPIGIFTNNEYGAAARRLLIREIIQVAACEGVTDLDFHAADPRPEDSPIYRQVPSTAQDVLRCRKTEIESLNGAVVRLGKKYGVPTPCNELVYNLIRVIEENYGERLYQAGE